MYWVYIKQAAIYDQECEIKGIAPQQCSLLYKILADMSHADFRWIIFSMMIFVLSNVIRAYRWRMMFQSIGYNPSYINLLGAIFINYFANLGIPRSGEIIRGTVISKYDGIPLDKALGTIVLDRLLDALMFAIFVVISLFIGGKAYLDYLQKNSNFSSKFELFNRVPWPLWLALSVMVVFTTYILIQKRKTLMAMPTVQKIGKVIKGVLKGLQSIKEVEKPWLFSIQTVSIWICYFMMLYVMFFAFKPTEHLGLSAALIVFVFGSLGMLIPSPGGMGAYHYLISEGLQLNGVGSTDGFTFANILFFSIQVGITLICGILALIALPLLNKK
jgi:hypothetical protein